MSDELQLFLEENNWVSGDLKLGQFVTDLFADKRRELRSLIDGEMGRLEMIERKHSRTQRRPRPPDTRSESERFRPVVLVIDDSELSRDLMLELLSEAGIAAVGMPTALGAIQTVLDERIGVVVTDVNMPQMPGPELVRRFRKNPETAHVRIVLASALPLDQLQALAASIDVDGIVEKDQIEAELVPMVKSLLGADLAEDMVSTLPGYA
jgi:two-component system chemotaxis response regulator CheY